MPEEAVIDSPQAGAAIVERPDEQIPANRPDEEQPKPERREPPTPAVSLADSIRAKLKAKQPPEAEKPAKPEPEKAPKPKAKKKPDAEVEQSATVDPIKLAEAQGREIGDRILKGMKPSESKQDAVPAPSDEEIAKSLPEEYKADVAVYSEMKRMFPEKHGAILTKLKDAATKETKYIEAWESQHPDETFDPEDSAHNAFYKKTFPEIPERDFEAAKDSLKEARIEAKLDAKYKTQIEAIQKEKAADKLAPVIQQRVGDVIESALGAIDESLAAIARDPKKLNELQESNPIAADVVLAIHQKFSPQMAANIAIHQGTEEVSHQNQTHVALFDLAQEIERKTSAAPLEQRMDAQGRVFATRAQFQQMSPEEQARHWFVDQEVLAYVIAQKAAHTAKEWYDSAQEKHKKWAKANGVTLPSETPNPQTPKAEDTPLPTNGAPKPSSPPMPGRGQVASPWSQGDQQPKSGREYFLRSLRGR